MEGTSQHNWREELWWSWSWIAFVLALTIAPYVVGAIATPSGKVFLGSLLNTDDTAQFLAAMRQGAEGYWLYRNPFTPEDTRPVIMYPLYMVWGKLTGWVGLHPALAYHLLRLGGATLLLLVIQRLGQSLLPAGGYPPLWRTAFLLAAFSSGFSWLMAFLPQEIGTRFMADLSLIELSTFQTLFVVPHFAWGLMLELLTFCCFLRAIRNGTNRQAVWRWSLGGGLACLGMGLVYPFALVVVYAVLAVVVGCAWLTRQDWARRALGSVLLIVSLSVAVMAYYGIVFLFDPMWHTTHVVGNTTGSPSILSAMSGYGLVLLFAVGGAAWIFCERRWRERGLGFGLVWAIVNGALPYLPVSFQGRFAAGWHVALSMLAALGLGWLGRRFPPRRAQRVRNIVVILTIPSTLLILLAGPYMAISQGEFPFYLAVSELEAIDWLAERVDAHDVVLASYAIGNVVPTRASCRVFVGHQFGSYELETKLALLEAFFAAGTTDAQRRELLRDYGVTFLYYGSIEREKGGFNPSQVAYLEQIYGVDGVAIYSVRLPTVGTTSDRS